MSTELTIKKGRGVPKDAEMAEAELALDLDNGTLYSKLGDGLVHALNEAPDADNYGHWKLQVDYGQPYQVVSGATANFEGTNGIKVTRTGDTVTIDGSELDLDEDADNYQYWTYKINGFSTTNVLSTQLLDFQSGDGIDIAKEGYGIKISATGGGGAAVHIGDTPPDSPEEGQQWMEVPASGEATMWIYDGAVWLQQPGGKDGADGADGVDGVDGVVTDGLWTDNGGGSISYNAGNVGINKDTPYNKLDIQSSPTDPLASPESQLAFRNGDNRAAYFTFDNNTDLTIYNTGSKAGTGGDTVFHQNSGEAMRIAAGGNVGIGVLTPSNINEPLVVQGSMKLRGASALWIGNTSGFQGLQALNSKNLVLKSNTSDGGMGFETNGAERMRINGSGRVDITGSLYVNGTPKIGTTELIDTLSTLRNATKDETTVKGLRDAIGNAVGGLIEKFEAMQEESGDE